jgi:hypothetical protein
LVNKSISEIVIKKWYERNRYHLECHSVQRIQIEREIKQNLLDVPFLLPHEFLFLLCNSTNRLEMIAKNHNPELTSEKVQLDNWQLPVKDRQGQYKVSHIHLLGDNAWTNTAPHIAMIENLNKDAESKNIRFIGLKSEPRDDTNKKGPKHAESKGSFAHQFKDLKSEMQTVKQSAELVLGDAKSIAFPGITFHFRILTAIPKPLPRNPLEHLWQHPKAVAAPNHPQPVSVNA